MTLRYELNFNQYHDHLVHVNLTFTAPTDSPTLWLPTWIAGSYLVREFAKHIAQVSYHTDTDHIAQKTNKNTFVLPHVKQGDIVNVSYDVYCHDLSVRTAFVDNTRIFGNFTSLLLMVSSQEQSPCQISLSVPQAFLAQNPSTHLASGLKHQTHTSDDGVVYVFDDVVAFDSYDYPFEIGTQSVFDFDVMVGDKAVNHRFFIAGRHQANLVRLKNDVAKICQSYTDWLGDVPFDDYTFMTMATGSEYGGLEHINSTALITPRTDLPSTLESDEPSADYQRFLGLCSHEYFHAWWVKSVKPDVMMDNDLTQESYTPLLWVFEGFTSYLDDLMLLRSGVINKDSYLKLLTAQLNRYTQTDGRHYQSVAESSFDTWIKLYRPDENTQNQSVSYYNKGALVALCLDLMLIKSGHRLFDVVKVFYDKAQKSPDKRYGLTTDELGVVIADMMGADKWQAFYDDYVIGTKEMPLIQLLGSVNIDTHQTSKPKTWGMNIKDDPIGLKITHIHRDSMASGAGLSFNDVIVAIDGIKADKDHLERTAKLAYHTKSDVKLHVFRRDELMMFTITSGQPVKHDEYRLMGDGSGWLDF
ncbi:MAG: PDZ domain-containing protein [Moraxella sp.]|nr:PDZ domain-containing protein [Moraxella sp.]